MANNDNVQEELRTLYPPFEPFFTDMLKVDDIHTIYYEISGNKDGQPVIIIHGGPGGGFQDSYRQYFDPEKYCIYGFDQRGCGRSTPHACLKNNTTWDLVDDIEKIREKENIEKWVVFGGSWGSTLSLTYAETHPSRVKALILRGIFTLRRKELLWFYQEGANFIFPDAWEDYKNAIPEVERGDFMSAYYRRLTGDNEEEKLNAAAAWTKWEMSTSRLNVDPKYIQRAEDPSFALQFARIECHYFVNGGFFKKEGQLIKDATILSENNIPGVIVQGRYDVVCPAITAFELNKVWTESDLQYTISGHSCKEVTIVDKLVRATDKYADYQL
eukprot:TRINITY_DN5666_c0_g1_i1.p1 TRINITY_DN5666_c0_g1~~TRINITY_DN5666_c0_g1_i1.p1  ORF type:complete len:329 (+),score=132.81 TRINITY_DN5666_c0_g1_i1:75-1061(+)